MLILQGDVQMCVSALIVLGEKVRSRIDEQTQEQWIISYIGRCRETNLSFPFSTPTSEKQARNGTNEPLYQLGNSLPQKVFFRQGKGRK